MVRFFNQKEEVISIELTPYGRDQFANGRFSPKYYAFYDSSILYDGVYGGLTESQNSIVTRISNNTPRIRPITRFTGSSAQVISLFPGANKDEYAQLHAWNIPFQRVLGTSSPWIQYIPSWDIRVSDVGTVGLNEGVSHSSTGSIPTLSASLEIHYESFAIADSEQKTYSLVSSDKIILDVQEINTIFKNNGNFDIEVYTSGSDGEIKSLGFVNPNSDSSLVLQRQSDPYVLALSVAGTQEETRNSFPVLNNKYVEFYLDVTADSEIAGISLPTDSTMYRYDVDRDPLDLCKILRNTGRDS
jgi:hypothetical protein